MELLEDANEKEEGEQKEEVPLKQKEVKSEEKVLKCTTCGETATFSTSHEQRKHFKE